MLDYLARWIATSDENLVLLALWSAHTHVFDHFATTPYLYFHSAEPESGKTRAMDVLSLFCHEPQQILDPTPAVVYRVIASRKPTLIVDEIDHIFGPKANYPQLQSIFNGGFETGTDVPRMGGSKMTELEFFSPYCPKVFAGLVNLPSMLASRCLQIEMRPRTDVEPGGDDFIKEDEREQTADLRDHLAELLSRARENGALPRKPPRIDNPALRDRQQAALRPLHAIALAAGGEWPAWFRKAVDEHVANGTSTRSGQSRGVRLLADLYRVFADRGDPATMFTDEIVNALLALDDGPWGESEYLTPKKLATMLNPYISPKRARNIRIGEKQLKGYARADFFEPWLRYKISATPLKDGEMRPNRPRRVFKPFRGESAADPDPTHPSQVEPAGRMGRVTQFGSVARDPLDHPGGTDGTDGTDGVDSQTDSQDTAAPAAGPLPSDRPGYDDDVRYCTTCEEEKQIKKRRAGLEYLTCGHHEVEGNA